MTAARLHRADRTAPSRHSERSLTGPLPSSRSPPSHRFAPDLFSFIKKRLVRPRGLEPPPLAGLAPQASASTNSAMAASDAKTGPLARPLRPAGEPEAAFVSRGAADNRSIRRRQALRSRGIVAALQEWDRAVADADAGLNDGGRLADQFRHLDGDAVAGHH